MPRSDGRAALWSGLGNLSSKGLAFIRNLVLAATIGTALVADAYNVANNVPNMLYLLLGGGAIATVFVPQITRLARESQRRADEFSTLLLVVVTAAGLVLVVSLIAATPLLVSLFGGSAWSSAQRELATSLSYWCLPQIVFYAIYAIQTQILNSRGKFVAAAWVSSANSVVVLATCIPILLLGSVKAYDPLSLTTADVTLLGAGALAGTVVQSLLLAWVAVRSGFAWKLPSSLRSLGLRSTASIATWTLVASLCYQVSSLVVVAVTARAGSEASLLGDSSRGYSVYYNAFTLVTLVQSILIATFGNILLARMAHHREHDSPNFALKEFEDTLIRAAALVAPVSGVLVSLGVPLTSVLFTRGNTTLEAAASIGVSVMILGLGVIPYSLHMLMIRGFYAFMLPRPPLVSALVVNGTWITGALAAQIFAPPMLRGWFVAAAFVAAYWLDFPLKFGRLRRHLGYQMSATARRGLIRLGVSTGLSTAIVAGGVLISAGQGPLTYGLAASQLAVGGAAFVLIHLAATFKSGVSVIDVARWLRG
ncbi:murein biosynthesis integral membrane protein MurJ [Microbacterium sp. AG238]|uniref:murein biosynthesis integral membrane protein MurJ n=1 Tax=Microbacterium sp. AG238 TaxID=2183994 RepID=UPI000E7117EC|nr:lipid II flippase MurJ [Microbacterium sp. AG238]RKE59338.1 putative peptidoglycan lipid II flippase [Microbacterium sp. AG238]